MLEPGKYSVSVTAIDGEENEVPLIPVRGEVDGVRFDSGYPELLVDGRRLKMSDITGALMGKYDLFRRNSQPRSLLNPGQSTESQPTESRWYSFEQILAAELPAGNLRLTDEVKSKLKQVGIDLKPLARQNGSAIDKLKDSGGQKGMLVSKNSLLWLMLPGALSPFLIVN